MLQKSATMFVGVNVGYQADAVIADHEEARALVQAQISSLHIKNVLGVYPARVVYQKAHGCPADGEPVAYVEMSGDPAAAVWAGESLRAAFNQATVSVTTYTGSAPFVTSSFTVEATGDLKTLARLWQEAEENYAQQHHVDVSCGMYQMPGGRVVISGALNPLYKTDPDAWKKAALSIISALGTACGLREENVRFQDVGFHYHRAPGRTNSRGMAPPKV